MASIIIIVIINLIWDRLVWKGLVMINLKYQEIKVLIILIWMMSVLVPSWAILINLGQTLLVNFSKVMIVPVVLSQNIKNIKIYMIL